MCVQRKQWVFIIFTWWKINATEVKIDKTLIDSVYSIHVEYNFIDYSFIYFYITINLLTTCVSTYYCLCCATIKKLNVDLRLLANNCNE